jgi:ABC-type amino acid transport system permease subunit
VVRGGIAAVAKGQWEAASFLAVAVGYTDLYSPGSGSA